MTKREQRWIAQIDAGGIAEVQVSSKTVLRDWESARAWLQRELSHEAGRDA